MSSLTLHNIDDSIISALKTRAQRHGVSIETEHWKILEMVLRKPAKPKFAAALMQIPQVGLDSDFERKQDDHDKPVFD
jgi:plasmid stability protein